jgi:hypothetical protein
MKRKAGSTKEVCGLLRAMMQHALLENVEPASVQQTPENKMQFQLRLKL